MNFTDPAGLEPVTVPCYFIGQGGNTFDGAWAPCEYDPHAPRGGPQSPPPDVDALRADLESHLKGPCGEFIAAVLDELGSLTGKSPFSNNALKIFNEIVSGRQKGIIADSGYRAYASVGSGQGKIGMPNPPPGNDVLVNNYIRGLVHELIHVAPGSGSALYSHYFMALAAYNVAVARGYEGAGKRPEAGDGDYQHSVHFESRQFDACGPNAKR